MNAPLRQLALGLFLPLFAVSAMAQTPADPPGRVGRLAFVDGTVSFHDVDHTDWTTATLNMPLTTGDALWTEASARGEVSVAGTRLRLAGGSELDLVTLDDSRTDLQLPHGRLDISTNSFDGRQPFRIVTPRGVISLQAQGDYYVEAGSTDDATRLGVRSGAAQIQTADGQVLAVRAGEVGEVSGDGSAPQLHFIRSAPPPMPEAWADRDRQVTYAPAALRLSISVTGYEDLAAAGLWLTDPEYGDVWSPRVVPADWQPYRDGRWVFVAPWGWTWIDDQPWGFAPYHYGRWAHRGERWVWIPPRRDTVAVYAPALVAFVGGVELGITLSLADSAPVGWFPLGPFEAYVPPYSRDRDYYRRMNSAERVREPAMDEHWRRAERHEATRDDPNQANRRYTTVVSARDFAHSRPVQRSVMPAPADQTRTAPVAHVAAPPAPTHSFGPERREADKPGADKQGAPRSEPGKPEPPKPQQTTSLPPPSQQPVPTRETRFGNMPQLAKPSDVARPPSPGPQVVSHPTPPPPAPAKPALPPVAPRTGTPPPQIQGERTAVPHPAPPPPPPAPQQHPPDKKDDHKK